MDTKKLERWANLLLDTGKRNNLINFKDSKVSSVEVILPAVDALFAKVESTASFEVYDPVAMASLDIIEEESAPEAEPAPESESVTASESTPAPETAPEAASAPESARVREEPSRSSGQMTRELYAETYGPRIRRANQILLYNPQINSPVLALKNIHKRAKSAIEETGVNVAYITFGFIHWHESDDSSLEYQAPILLSPVYFKNESAISPYYVQMSEDGVIVNPTFRFKLEAERGITLPPYEDEGLEEYLKKIENIVSRLGWTVSKECKIGIFSFLKINMYQDLMKNSEEILANPNIRMLLGEPAEEEQVDTEEKTEPLDDPLTQLHNVVDADSSQLDAIEMARSGVSFVLQGPPGTGKSQTITNIIAECLSEGRKVLFVSEKLAALNVVYDKLKKAGLDEFCLELHSYKANKKDVIDNLCHTLHAKGSVVKPEAETEILQKIRARQKLDDYERELHAVREPIHRSLYRLYDAYAACRDVPDMGITLKDIAAKGEDYRYEAASLLGQYADYVPSMGRDYRSHCWYGYTSPDSSLGVRRQLKTTMQELAEGLEEMIPEAEAVSKEYGILCDTWKLAWAWRDLLRAVSDRNFLTPVLLDEGVLEKVRRALPEVREQGLRIVALCVQVEKDYDVSDLIKLPVAEYNKKLQRQYNSLMSRMFNGEYRQMIQDLRLANKNGRKASYSEALRITEITSKIQDEAAIFSDLEGSVKDLLGSAYTGVDTDWDQLEADLMRVEAVLAASRDCADGSERSCFGSLANMTSEEFSQEKDHFLEVSRRLELKLTPCRRAEAELLHSFDAEEQDPEALPLKVLLRKLDDCMNTMDTLDHWCRLWSVVSGLRRLDLAEYLDTAIDRNLPASDLVKSFERSFYHQWIDHVLLETPVLAEFHRVAQDQTVNIFKEKDEIQFAISKAQIKASLSAKRPSTDVMAAGSAVSVLLREGEKKRRQKSIRMLLAETGELVQRLKPCFLMSPLSVSTFLNSEDIRFDVVIFDEASQIFPQDAIGAIYRGAQLIVVGDSRQMPPSDFFQSTTDVEGDEETGDIADFESILDLCSTALPQRRLKWHYRSRYEELITFSNRNFYDNDLVTFPSSSVDREGVGVDYYYVDGVFDHRSRSNRKEAEFIVEKIFRHIDEYPERSLGVVAFSISQQDLIERLLSKRRQEDPSREFFFKADAAEPFFIKNLETVQGDERDTIIFSVAYAHDSQGRLLHNFGPLNRVGGERRLNVAVTRAKLNIQLVASIHHTDIDLKRTQAAGARLLREYLDYAENGSVALERAVSVDPYERYDSDFEREVCDFLRENGYTVDTQVGCSSFRIDLALKRPDSSDYVLAIECDGASYHSAKNARDRDRLRQAILERMGWKFYRIWSTDWFKNNSVEKRSLLEICDRALREADLAGSGEAAGSNRTVEVAVSCRSAESAEPAGEENIFEETAEEHHLQFPVYERADVDGCFVRTKRFSETIAEILKTEAPLSEDWLLKRICSYFNRTKVTAAVTDEYKQLMKNCARDGIVRRGGFLYLESQTEYVLRLPAEGDEKREIRHIAPEELAAGIREILKQNVTAEKDSLFRSLAKLLGYSRMGEAIHEQMELALEVLGDELEEDGEMLSLRE